MSSTTEADQPPADYLDPITMDLMEDPVVTCDGQTYDRRTIEEWLRTHRTSPLTGAVLLNTTLVPNIVLRRLLADYRASRQTQEGSALPPQLVRINGTAEAETAKALVYKSYGANDRCGEAILITDVLKISSIPIKQKFDAYKASKPGCRVVSALHGTTKDAMGGIARENLKVPDTFERSQRRNSTNTLSFGRAIYFTEEAGRAVEYGKAVLVVADVALGRELQLEESMCQLTLEKVLQMGADSVVTSEELAVYRPEQVLPRYVMTYAFIKPDGSRSDPSAAYVNITPETVSPEQLMQDLSGSTRFRDCALRKMGDWSRDSQGSMVRRLLAEGQWAPVLPKVFELLAAPEQNRSTLWLALRLLWNSAYRRPKMQAALMLGGRPAQLVGLLKHAHEAIHQRATGVILNLCHQSSDHRLVFWSAGGVGALAELLTGSVRRENHEMTGLVLEALANVSFVPDARKQWTQHGGLLRVLTQVVEPLMDSVNSKVRDAAVRTFTCIISEGTAAPEWLRHGGKEVFEKAVRLDDDHGDSDASED